MLRALFYFKKILQISIYIIISNNRLFVHNFIIINFFFSFEIHTYVHIHGIELGNKFVRNKIK